MSDKRRLVYSVVEFLNREMASEEHSEDAKESLEVASQCLQTAFALSAQDDKHLAVAKKLEDIFGEATKDEPVRRGSAELFYCPQYLYSTSWFILWLSAKFLEYA